MNNGQKGLEANIAEQRVRFQVSNGGGNDGQKVDSKDI